jgi:hypothetical protein
MTPKEKAIELVAKYKNQSFGITTYFQHYKQCALIAVDEVLEATKKYDYTLGPNPSYNEYWLKVKYQIEKL